MLRPSCDCYVDVCMYIYTYMYIYISPGARKCLYRTFRKLHCNPDTQSRVVMRKLIHATGSGCPEVTPSVEPCRHAGIS